MPLKSSSMQPTSRSKYHAAIQLLPAPTLESSLLVSRSTLSLSLSLSLSLFSSLLSRRVPFDEDKVQPDVACVQPVRQKGLRLRLSRPEKNGAAS